MTTMFGLHTDLQSTPERQCHLLSAFAAAPALASPSLLCGFCAPRAGLRDPELLRGDLLCGGCLRGKTIYGAVELHFSEFDDGEVLREHQRRKMASTRQYLTVFRKCFLPPFVIDYIQQRWLGDGAVMNMCCHC